MFPQADPQKKIEELEGLIARAEERLRTLQAKAEPGAARMVHSLTNSIRKHRRSLQKCQLLHQQTQMQQAERDGSDRSGELPAKQDQEPRKPAPQQGAIAGQ